MSHGYRVFRPSEVAESNATTLPEPFRARNQTRSNRRLGDFAGLQNYGVNLTRIAPGGQSSYLHAHSRQDEFVYVLDGEVMLETGDGERQKLSPGMCAGFPAGTGVLHRFLNETDRDAVLLVIGDRTHGDELAYPPDMDLAGSYGPAGMRFRRRDGTPYE